MDLGFYGIKGPRELWMDAILPQSTTFAITVSGIESDLITTSTSESGSSGAVLGEFMLDESILVDTASAQLQIDLNGGDTRWLQLNIEEDATGQPHTVVGLSIPHVRKGVMIR